MTTSKTVPEKKITEIDRGSKKGKICFIVAPIGSEGSEIRRAIEGLLDAVLRPVLEDLHGYEVEIAHKISASGSISDQIMNFLLEADLVVVDLTGLNPNVMYELAIRHCIGLPLIVIARDGTNLPFDVVQERTIFYQNDMHGAVDLRDRLDTAVKNINEGGGQTDNPVTRSRQAQVVREKLKSGKGGEADVMKFVLDQINDLRSMISRSPSVHIPLGKPNFGTPFDLRGRLNSAAIKSLLIQDGFKDFSVNENKNVDKDIQQFVIDFDSKLNNKEVDKLIDSIGELKSSNQSFVVNSLGNSFLF